MQTFTEENVRRQQTFPKYNDVGLIWEQIRSFKNQGLTWPISFKI